MGSNPIGLNVNLFNVIFFLLLPNAVLVRRGKYKLFNWIVLIILIYILLLYIYGLNDIIIIIIILSLLAIYVLLNKNSKLKPLMLNTSEIVYTQFSYRINIIKRL